ncbi:MAG: hypothetical protein VX903_02840 [Pseudomonadota bacterium]|jgi:hypothetical protein|nr:hypothetical protein [Pseudomonadota bacterium]MEC7982337.1 hypothetical protein [Pseudomonadota bacterium]MEC8539305.1 hypothetical protein [Pseudomonadota bacterium]MEC8551258.1 hypothetical protein [Pseudomonadota bacterium]
MPTGIGHWQPQLPTGAKTGMLWTEELTPMKAVAILFVCFSLLGLPAAAHQCILEGSSAGEIQAYNTCKADLASGNANHAAQDNKDELARLQAENDALKAQLSDIRRRLLGLLADL